MVRIRGDDSVKPTKLGYIPSVRARRGDRVPFGIAVPRYSSASNARLMKTLFGSGT